LFPQLSIGPSRITCTLTAKKQNYFIFLNNYSIKLIIPLLGWAIFYHILEKINAIFVTYHGFMLKKAVFEPDLL